MSLHRDVSCLFELFQLAEQKNAQGQFAFISDQEQIEVSRN